VWHYEYAPNESTFVGLAPLKSGTMRFERVTTGTHVICDVITASGIPFHFEYSGPEDGADLPVTGNPYYDSESTRWSDARTATRTERRAGKVIGSTTMVVAADGMSYTATSSRSAPEDGHLYQSTILWKRAER
jgi:hypothetical protein